MLGKPYRLLTSDCLTAMQGMEAESVDAIVTDPPYGLKFMGKEWDHGLPGKHFWEGALRVAKPGCHLLAFGGTRTFHRLACAIEDAGWEIRDCIQYLHDGSLPEGAFFQSLTANQQQAYLNLHHGQQSMGWSYGSGFPKSLDVGRAIDKAAGAEREVVGSVRTRDLSRHGGEIRGDMLVGKSRGCADVDITAPATDAAKQWNGWGTALKPAYEPIIVARKPLEGTVAANIQKHGCGGLNIDMCRVGENPGYKYNADKNGTTFHGEQGDRIKQTAEKKGSEVIEATKGRWPANLIHDGSEEVVEGFPETITNEGTAATNHKPGMFQQVSHAGKVLSNGSSGSAARFFYCAKASRSERGEGNVHPTVKPLALMRYLVRLVTPEGARVLDPFLGSGTTGVAAIMEGARFVGIDNVEEYVAIAKRRILEAWREKLRRRAARGKFRAKS